MAPSVYGQLLLGVGPALEYDLPEVTLLKKIDSSSPSSYQIPTAAQLVVGFYAHVPASMLVLSA